MYCKKCKSDQPEDNFLGLKGKLCKTCKSCREFSKNWKQKNKDRVKKYNDMSQKLNDKQNQVTNAYLEKSRRIPLLRLFETCA